jgi:excisionase family DNA binding protein
MNTPLMTSAEAAATLRVSKMTVHRLIRSGAIPALRVGHQYRIFRSDVDAFMQQRVAS